jgi:hypothetical protein
MQCQGSAAHDFVANDAPRKCSASRRPQKPVTQRQLPEKAILPSQKTLERNSRNAVESVLTYSESKAK